MPEAKAGLRVPLLSARLVSVETVDAAVGIDAIRISVAALISKSLVHVFVTGSNFKMESMPGTAVCSPTIKISPVGLTSISKNEPEFPVGHVDVDVHCMDEFVKLSWYIFPFHSSPAQKTFRTLSKSPPKMLGVPDVPSSCDEADDKFT